LLPSVSFRKLLETSSLKTRSNQGAVILNDNRNNLPEEFVSHGRGGICRPAVPSTVDRLRGIPFSSFAPALATPASATVAAVLGLLEGGANGDGPLLPACVSLRSHGFGGAGRPAFKDSSIINSEYTWEYIQQETAPTILLFL
jgi:hypothetical protein